VYETRVRYSERFGRFADAFVGETLFGGERRWTEAAVRDGEWNAMLREWAVAARWPGASDEARSVARHVHCVRGLELAFFGDMYRRHVLEREQAGMSENVDERRTPEQFLALLGSHERREKFRTYAMRALEYYLALDRAFALYGADLSGDGHWFSEADAHRLDAMAQAEVALPAALRAVVAAFSDTSGGRIRNGRMNKQYRWLLRLVGTRASKRFLPLLEPLFWVATSGEQSGGESCYRLHVWRSDSEESSALTPYPTAADAGRVWRRAYRATA
jgi:hypothetical protein